MDCLFCKIINKTIPAQIRFEDPHWLVFDDIIPKAPIHQLIIPKSHIESLNEVDLEKQPFIGTVFSVAQALAVAAGVQEAGYRLVNNCQAGAGQTVFHLHFHFLAGRIFEWPPG